MAVPAPNSQRDIRHRNLSPVLHAVADGGPSSRAAVAGRIGLTRAAVSTLVDELLDSGLLVELGPGRGAGGVGRPGSALALTEYGPCGIGAEIGIDHLTVCAVDMRGQVRARVQEMSTNRDSEPGPVLARLGELTDRAAAGDPSTCRALRSAGKALGIALAGAVNLLDPQAVVLGGAFARLAPWLLPALERELRHRTAARGSLPELTVSSPGSDGPLLGAAHSVVRAVLDDPVSRTAGHWQR